MRREDFKKINDIHIESAKEIVRGQGACTVVNCDDCPFCARNNTYDIGCIDAGYSSDDTDKEDKDEQLLESAKVFLKMFRTENCTFRNAEVNDRVWNIQKGWGTIISIKRTTEFLLCVKFDIGGICYFLDDGRYSPEDVYPTLFWDEIKFEIPKRSFNLERELRKLEIVKFDIGEKNYCLAWSNTDKVIGRDYYRYAEYPLIKYFTEDSINEFMDKIKNKQITKEQFFEAYRNVFN